MNDMYKTVPVAKMLGKFQDRFFTANSEARAHVAVAGISTLWFNTGTLCNIECVNCYIKSSPSNDDLVYMTTAEITTYLDQIPTQNWPVTEIGFTGGEPFMNPQMIQMAEVALTRGYQVLILTNAMVPMMRKRVQTGLVDLQRRFGSALTLRVSLDHHTAAKNDEIRGSGSFSIALKGMEWLQKNGIQMTVASRKLWAESDQTARAAFGQLFKHHGFDIDASSPASLVLFPEMDETVEVPEITTACWGLLNVDPKDVMCATSRMVVKRKGASEPAVLACTLLPYAPEFELGTTLAEAEADIYLNHRHCAKFCVLGGASCSG